MSREKIIVQKGYWITMLETAKYNKWDNDKIAEDIVKGVEEALNIQNVSNRRELLLGFQKSEYFDLYEQGVLEYKDAIEKYLA